MYRVVRYFTDLQDNDHAYHVGDEFPRVGLNVSMGRLAELASANNKQHAVLIEMVNEPDEQHYTAEELGEMSARKIRSIAENRGYKITKVAKADVINQFIEQQG